MSIWFRLSPSRVRPDAEMVEVFDGNRLVAELEPLPQLLGVQLVSSAINKFSVIPAKVAGTRAIEAFEILFTEKH